MQFKTFSSTQHTGWNLAGWSVASCRVINLMESKAICCVCCSEPSAFTRLSSGGRRLSSRAASMGRACCSRQLSSSSDLQRKETRGWASKLAITSRNMSPGSRAFVWNPKDFSYNFKHKNWNIRLSRNIKLFGKYY